MERKLSIAVALGFILGMALGCNSPVAPEAAETEAPPPPVAQVATLEPPPAFPTATLAPPPEDTPVEAPTASPLASPTPAHLALTNLNTVPPEDAAADMYHFGSGGPGEGELCHPPDEATGSPPVFERLPVMVEMYFCWPDPDSSVWLAVTDPLGRVDGLELPVLEMETDEITGEPGWQRYVLGRYQVGADRAAGDYNFQLIGSYSNVTRVYNLIVPEGPVFYEVFDDPFAPQTTVMGPRHRLRLSGFAPGENVRLFVHTNLLDWVGWQDLQVGEDGALWVNMDLAVDEQQKLMLSVVGTHSGEVHLAGSKHPYHVICPGALPTRLKQGNARVLQEVHGLGDSKDVIIDVPFLPGEQVFVEYGPYCQEGAWWWDILGENGMAMLPESADGEYLLEPIE